jgi:hypothetical protein
MVRLWHCFNHNGCFFLMGKSSNRWTLGTATGDGLGWGTMPTRLVRPTSSMVWTLGTRNVLEGMGQQHILEYILIIFGYFWMFLVFNGFGWGMKWHVNGMRTMGCPYWRSNMGFFGWSGEPETLARGKATMGGLNISNQRNWGGFQKELQRLGVGMNQPKTWTCTRTSRFIKHGNGESPINRAV